jgi:hypothetical protein
MLRCACWSINNHSWIYCLYLIYRYSNYIILGNVMSSNGRYSRWKLWPIMQKAGVHWIAVAVIIFVDKPSLAIMTTQSYYIYTIDLGFESWTRNNTNDHCMAVTSPDYTLKTEFAKWQWIIEWFLKSNILISRKWTKGDWLAESHDENEMN